MDRLTIFVDPNLPDYEGTDGVSFGDLFTKAGVMEEKKLTWKVMAKETPAAVAESENIYLLIRYVYVGKNIS